MAINAIIKRRKELKLTQEDVATSIGLTRKQYNVLEKSGKGKIENLFKVLTKLNLKLQVIRNEDDNILEFKSSPDVIKQVKNIENVVFTYQPKLTWRDRLKQ